MRSWNPETEDITSDGISDETVARISSGKIYKIKPSFS